MPPLRVASGGAPARAHGGADTRLLEKRLRHGRLAKLAHHLDDCFGHLGRGWRLDLHLAGKKVEDAVGELARQKGVGPAQALQDGKQVLADLIRIKGDLAAVAFRYGGEKLSHDSPSRRYVLFFRG